MKVVLFCGGLGTRLREHSDTIPKPLVNVGSRPIIWHLMRYYAHYGHKDFVLCLGYRGDLIREYFRNYDECLSNDFTLSNGGRDDRTAQLRHRTTGGSLSSTPACTRTSASACCACDAISRANEMFLANYADGLSDLPLDRADRGFRAAAGRRQLRVGALAAEFPSRAGGRRRPGHGDRPDAQRRALHQRRLLRASGARSSTTCSEGEELVEQPFARLIAERRLATYRHTGFWQAMDTFKDKITFDRMEARGDCPWMLWRSRTATAGK